MRNKAQLGIRYTCFGCGCKFYDLGRPEAICPKCARDQGENPAPSLAMLRKLAMRKKRAPAPDEKSLDMDLDDDSDKTAT